MKSNFFESAIELLSPGWAHERAKNRQAVEHLRSYNGASKSRRTEDWNAKSTSSNSETKNALSVLRNRTREQDRNNPYAKKAINVITTNTIGAGIRISITLEESKKIEYLKHWNKWANKKYCDFDEQLNFYGLQKLVMRTVALSGEALIVKEVTNLKDGRVPLQLKVLEGDYLDHAKDLDKVKSGSKVSQGIQYDKKGKREGYWLFKQHPGDDDNYDSKSFFVKASNVIHVFLKDRPGQDRGVPFGAASMNLLKDFKDYQDAELLRQKIASCFALFVQDAPDTDNPSTLSVEDMTERVEPGIIEHLPPGKTITMASPPSTTGYGEHTKRLLQAIAAGYGITYEALTGDMSMVNFSSGRMGWLEFHRQIQDWQLNMMIPQMCEGVYEWWSELATASGIIKEVADAEWTAPRREMIDPVKEIAGLKEQVRNGFISYQEAVRELGYDPDNLLTELKADMDKLKTLGLILDIDGRNEMEVALAKSAAGEEKKADKKTA